MNHPPGDEWLEGHIEPAIAQEFLDAHPEIRCAACHHPRLEPLSELLAAKAYYDPGEEIRDAAWAVFICSRCSHVMLFRARFVEHNWVIPWRRD